MIINEGIVIKSNKYLENSKIINVLSSEGLKSFLVKSGMKLTNKATSYTQDISLIEFDFSKGKGFDILTTGKVLNSYVNIKSDFSRLEYVYLVFELIMEFNSHVNDNKLLYDFTVFTLDKINTSNYYKYYYLIFALKLLFLLGVGPEFSKCVRCGNKKPYVGFDFNSSGMICEDCANNSELLYNSDTIKYCKILYLTKLDVYNDEYLNKVFEEDKFKEIYSFISRYYNTYLGFKSKTIKVFDSLNTKNREELK